MKERYEKYSEELGTSVQGISDLRSKMMADNAKKLNILNESISEGNDFERDYDYSIHTVS